MVYDQTRLIEFSGFLEKLASSLDLTEAQYRDATERYQKLGNFLNEDGSSLAPFNPIIAAQGSFALGTIIKPETDEEQYDVDLTCVLNLSPKDVTQQSLKKMVGDRLKESPVYSRILGEEKRRCWPLNYAEGTRFHMDVVPAIPDIEALDILRQMMIPSNITLSAICITDKETWDKDVNWPRSNPRGYITWFKSRMQLQFDVIRQRFLNLEMRGKVEDIPEFRFKTPLQRAIQILKRHRDRRYSGEPDLKPISIILTTLAAHVYENEETIYQTLMNLLDKMPRLIKYENGIYTISNPVDPRENFADKWNENPKKALAFFEWMKLAKADLEYIFSLKGWDQITKKGSAIFGESVMRRLIAQYGEEMRILRERGNLTMEQSGLLSTTASTVVRPHQFSTHTLDDYFSTHKPC
ncbi:MAG: nucleotidyltransferase [Saprospiraceae bacterium]